MPALCTREGGGTDQGQLLPLRRCLRGGTPRARWPRLLLPRLRGGVRPAERERPVRLLRIQREARCEAAHRRGRAAGGALRPAGGAGAHRGVQRRRHRARALPRAANALQFVHLAVGEPAAAGRRRDPLARVLRHQGAQRHLPRGTAAVGRIGEAAAPPGLRPAADGCGGRRAREHRAPHGVHPAGRCGLHLRQHHALQLPGVPGGRWRSGAEDRFPMAHGALQRARGALPLHRLLPQRLGRCAHADGQHRPAHRPRHRGAVDAQPLGCDHRHRPRLLRLARRPALLPADRPVVPGLHLPRAALRPCAGGLPAAGGAAPNGHGRGGGEGERPAARRPHRGARSGDRTGGRAAAERHRAHRQQLHHRGTAARAQAGGRHHPRRRPAAWRRHRPGGDAHLRGQPPETPVGRAERGARTSRHAAHDRWGGPALHHRCAADLPGGRAVLVGQGSRTGVARGNGRAHRGLPVRTGAQHALRLRAHHPAAGQAWPLPARCRSGGAHGAHRHGDLRQDGHSDGPGSA